MMVEWALWIFMFLGGAVFGQVIVYWVTKGRYGIFAKKVNKRT